jgi:hypothetical protein
MYKCMHMLLAVDLIPDSAYIRTHMHTCIHTMHTIKWNTTHAYVHTYTYIHTYASKIRCNMHFCVALVCCSKIRCNMHFSVAVMRLSAYICMHTYIYIPTSAALVRNFVYTHTYIYVHMHIYIYTYTHTHTYIHVHMSIHTHTHIHTYIRTYIHV